MSESSDSDGQADFGIYDLRESPSSSDSDESGGSGGSPSSASTISESIADPGGFDEENPPDIEVGKLYEVIIGRWVLPNNDPPNVQNVVYPHVNTAGAISYRIQPFDEQGNPRVIPQRGWRVSAADTQGQPLRAVNRGGYFEYDPTVTRVDADHPILNPRERIRGLIQRHIHTTRVEKRQEQQRTHKKRRLNHTGRTPKHLEAIYRRQLIRRLLRRSARQAIRRANRRTDRRVHRVAWLHGLQDLDKFIKYVKMDSYGTYSPPDWGEELEDEEQEGD